MMFIMITICFCENRGCTKQLNCHRKNLNLGLKHCQDSVCVHLYVCEVSVFSVLLFSVSGLHFSLLLDTGFLHVVKNTATNSSIGLYPATEATRSGLAQHPSVQFKNIPSNLSIGSA